MILAPPKIKTVNGYIVSPSICHEVMWPDAMIFIFWMLSFKATFSLSSFTFIKRLFSSSSFSAIRLVSSAYLKLLIFLPAILIPACNSSSLAFFKMYSAHKSNKQSDSGHGTTDWFQIGKGVHQGCILSHCLFNLYAKYVMWNAGLDEAQAGIKIARRNINNLRYADDTTLMAETE